MVVLENLENVCIMKSSLSIIGGVAIAMYAIVLALIALPLKAIYDLRGNK